MKIAIVGAGINGLSSALALARAGHQVTVYEQGASSAEAASFAPAGWLSPSHCVPLAAPDCGLPLKQLRQGKPPLLTGNSLPGSRNWRWLRQWQRQGQHRDNSPPPQATLAAWTAYSASLYWQHCPDPHQLAERNRGALLLLRDPAECAAWQARLAQTPDEPATLVSPQVARTLEPGLGQELPLAGAVHFPQAQSMNSRLWCQQLRQDLGTLGVRLWTSAQVEHIHPPSLSVQVQGQNVAYEAIVLCTGADTRLLHSLGLALPLLPVAGYSITTPVRDALLAPRAAVLDWAQQTSITRLGQRVRISAGAELGAAAHAPQHQPTLQRMYALLRDWFPGGAQLASPHIQVWRGQRGLLPDGLPALGPSGPPGIWLNLAHGSHGLSLAAGCAQALADLLTGQPCALDAAPLHPLRFQP